MGPGEEPVLKGARGLSFEELLAFPIIGILRHPGRSNQQMFLFEVSGCIWVAPFVLGEKEIFLKTLYPSRKFTKLWRAGGTI